MKRLKILLLFFLNIFLIIDRGFALSIKEEARGYRQKGYEVQRLGDIDSALIYYQKAIQMDPYCPIITNDLGVIYEMKGYLDKAEDMYLKAIQLNPKYTAPYSNLALLYERKNDILKAAHFWKKRIQLGDLSDLWTQKAKEKRKALGKISLEVREELIEEETAKLTEKILKEKKAKIKFHLDSGKDYYSKGKYEEAIREFKEVLSLDPQNPEAKDFLVKAIHKNTELKIRELSEKGIKYYTDKDYSQSLKEFEKILIYLLSTKDLSEKIQSSHFTP